MDQVYTDFSGLNQLKAEAKQNGQDSKTIASVSKQFESLFVNMMLQNLRQANAVFGEDNELRGDTEKLYENLFDNQISLNIAQGKSVGLADILVQQLSQQKNVSSDAMTENSTPLVRENMVLPSGSSLSNTMALTDSAQSPYFENPVDFVRSLWPHAVQAAQVLKADPRVLVAQAALETGWGKSIAQGKSGSSHNLFGIKADPSWTKDRIYANTMEVNQGVLSRQVAPFRGYQSIAESFSDYANFLQSNPRYRSALSSAHDPHAFADALQKAGYATDPHYASKIKALLHHEAFETALKGA